MDLLRWVGARISGLLRELAEAITDSFCYSLILHLLLLVVFLNLKLIQDLIDPESKKPQKVIIEFTITKSDPEVVNAHPAKAEAIGGNLNENIKDSSLAGSGEISEMAKPEVKIPTPLVEVKPKAKKSSVVS